MQFDWALEKMRQGEDCRRVGWKDEYWQMTDGHLMRCSANGCGPEGAEPACHFSDDDKAASDWVLVDEDVRRRAADAWLRRCRDPFVPMVLFTDEAQKPHPENPGLLSFFTRLRSHLARLIDANGGGEVAFKEALSKLDDVLTSSDPLSGLKKAGVDILEFMDKGYTAQVERLDMEMRTFDNPRQQSSGLPDPDIEAPKSPSP